MPSLLRDRAIAAMLALLFFAAPALACPRINGVRDVNCDGRLVIVAFGDSMTRGWGAPKNMSYPDQLDRMLPRATTYNFGWGGEDSYRALPRVREKLRSMHGRIDYAIFNYGINDYWIKDSTPLKSAVNVVKMKREAERNHAIGIVTTVTPWLPFAGVQLAQWDFCQELTAILRPVADIDFAAMPTDGIWIPDSVHFNAHGYNVMAQIVRARLRYTSR